MATYLRGLQVRRAGTVNQTWSASNGYMQNAVNSQWYPYFFGPQPDGNVDMQMSYRMDSATGGMFIYPRRYSTGGSTDRVELDVLPGTMTLKQNLSGTLTTLATANVTTTQGVWYDLRMELDGGNVNIWQGPRGGVMTKVLSVSNCTELLSTLTVYMMDLNSQWSIDNIRMLNSRSTTTTLAYDNANELTSASKDNGTTSYTYDTYGRMTGKTLGSFAATYGYNYGDKLTSVTSNFPWESGVTYAYGGDGKRRSRTAGGSTAQYKWGAGFNLVNEETSAGALSRTYYGRLAEVAGTDPASGAYRYYYHDHLGSTRRVTDQSKAALANYEYTPYGEDLFRSGPTDVMYRYATLARDGASGLDFARYRYYAAGTGRWLTRDPLGMTDGTNTYSYVASNPGMLNDSTGAVWDTIWDVGNVAVDIICGHPMDALVDTGFALVPFVPAGATKLARVFGKLPKFSTPNSLKWTIFQERSGLVYPSVAFFDHTGEQALRTDWGPGHWGFGEGSTPHTHLNPNASKASGAGKTYIGSMWDKLCL